MKPPLLISMLLPLLLLPTTARAQEVSAMHPGALAHALDRLNTTGRVLYVAAHPDDENTRLLAYLANSRHVTAAYLSLTRGEGGQNLIGAEKGELLGIIRTQELLAARRLDGAVQRFTRMRDFGYSKSPEETLRIWGEEEALADVVWTLRTFQPDVVITRFDEQPPNHGHHTASAILAKRAVEAAADPSRFPEQLAQGAKPWKVTRLVHNTSPWRGPPPAGAMPVDVGGYDVRLGLSYGELAARSRSQHKSQGFGSATERGVLLEHFVHVAGSPAKSDLLEDIDLTWGRFGAAAAPLGRALTEAESMLERDVPERALGALVQAARALEALPESPRTRDAQRQLQSLLLDASGLFLRATAPVGTVTPGAKVPLKLEVVVRRPVKVELRKVRFPGAGASQAVNAALELNAKREVAGEAQVARDAAPSMPYWLTATANGGRDAVEDLQLVGLPEEPAPLLVSVELELQGRALTVEVPVEHVWTDRVHGERVRRVLVAPPVTVSSTREAVMLPNGGVGRVDLRVRAHRAGVEGALRLPLPLGWSATPASQPVSLAQAGGESMVSFEVRAPKGGKEKPTAVTVAPVLVMEGKETPAFREDVIDHPHLPVQVVLQPTRIRLSPVTVKLPRGLVGYVEGSGDTVAEDLEQVGVRVQVLDDVTLRSGDLSRYAAIVLGIRAFNTRPMLQGLLPRLTRYAEGGGTVVVQYNTHSRFSPLDATLGPYPLTLGQGRVTDERAEMSAVTPVHAVLTTPNRLGPGDWEGWVQERGLYFAEKWDGRWTPVLRCADPGEPAQEGALLVAQTGKGRWIYTGLAFFRQLPAGVPGAYRLFVNLVERR